MPELKNLDLLLVLLFVFPGFLGMKVFSLIHPTDRIALKDNIAEAIALSVANFALMSWTLPLFYGEGFSSNHPVSISAFVVLIAVVSPIGLAFVLRWFIRLAAARNWILSPYRTPWDEVFLRRHRYWMIVHLKDGRRIGGYFGSRSAASLHPTPGHPYIEELWELDPQTGEFRVAAPGTSGILLRPDDYQLVEMYEA